MLFAKKSCIVLYNYQKTLLQNFWQDRIVGCNISFPLNIHVAIRNANVDTVNIAATHVANRRAWRSCTTLSVLYSVIIPSHDIRAFLHGPADRGTQRPGYGLNPSHSSYDGFRNHRRFWSPRWRPQPLRLTPQWRNHPG